MKPIWISAVAGLLAWPALALAQGSPQPSVMATNEALKDTPAPSGRQGRHSVEVAYWGHNFFHPGGQLGYTFRAVESPGRLHALVVGADVGGYAWMRHDFGAFVLPRIGWRGRHRAGLQGEANFHIGYLQSVLASPAYAVENGQVVSSSRAGIANLLFGATVGIGFFIPRAGITPFARVGAVWQTPVFDATLVRFVLNLGVEVRL